MKTSNLIGLTVAGFATLLVMRKMRPSPIDLSGQVMLITGSSRGLGFILARELARQGCDIVLCARDADELEQVRAELRREGITVTTIAPGLMRTGSYLKALFKGKETDELVLIAPNHQRRLRLAT